MFNCNKIQDSSPSPEKVSLLNNLIYGSPFCVIICTSYKLLNMVRFLWPTLVCALSYSYYVSIMCLYVAR